MLCEKKLHEIHRRVRQAQIGVLDAAAVLRAAPPAATWDHARLRLAEATGELSGAINLLYEAEDPEWCDGCGDGATGVQEHVERGPIPCGVCASVKAKGGLALVGGAPVDEGGA